MFLNREKKKTACENYILKTTLPITTQKKVVTSFLLITFFFFLFCRFCYITPQKKRQYDSKSATMLTSTIRYREEGYRRCSVLGRRLCQMPRTEGKCQFSKSYHRSKSRWFGRFEPRGKMAHRVSSNFDFI